MLRGGCEDDMKDTVRCHSALFPPFHACTGASMVLYGLSHPLHSHYQCIAHAEAQYLGHSYTFHHSRISESMRIIASNDVEGVL